MRNWKKKKISNHVQDNYDVKSTKNIVKNYGRAICNFILAPISKVYLVDILKKHGDSVTLKQFSEFIKNKKEDVDCIERFKAMLMIKIGDSSSEKTFKSIFLDIGEIFIKYFSVNWIYNGRLTYKESHLNFRFKMLRRLRNPELFTYLKSNPLRD